jgi:hypothetical protein
MSDDSGSLARESSPEERFVSRFVGVCREKELAADADMRGSDNDTEPQAVARGCCHSTQFGVRRQSEATTALWMRLEPRIQSGVALRLPPHSKTTR